MLSQIALVPYLVSAVCGAIHAWLAIQFWGLYVVDNSIISWMSSSFDSGDYKVLRYLTIYAHDLAVNVLIAIPVALAIAFLRPYRNWSFLWVALVAAMLVMNWGVFVEPAVFFQLVGKSSFLLSLLFSAVSLPLAYLAVVTLSRPRNAT